MTLTLSDRTQAITINGITPEDAAVLVSKLPEGIRITIADDTVPKPAGYFGLAVALARQTWRGEHNHARETTPDPAVQSSDVSDRGRHD